MKWVHICSFQSADDVTRKTKYETLKAQVLKAGRFSVFEATASQRAAAMFNDLCRDPEIETEQGDFPWTIVRQKGGSK